VRVGGAPDAPEVEVLELLAGADPGARIALGAARDGCGGLDPPLQPGETALLLLTSRDGGLDCLPGWPASHVSLAPEETQETAALVKRLAAALAEGGDESTLRGILRDQLGIRSERLRGALLADLGERLGAADVPFLVELSRDRARPVDVRSFALRRLAPLAPLPEPAALGELLGADEPLEVRQAALQALAPHAGREARALLERGLADASPAVRRVAVENLAGEAAVPALTRRFAVETDATVRVAIARRLGQIGGAEAAAALREILADAVDPALRRAAEDALALATAAESR
jgi:HEAT repeat protein